MSRGGKITLGISAAVIVIGGVAASWYFMWGKPSDEKVESLIAYSKSKGYDTFEDNSAFGRLSKLSPSQFKKLDEAMRSGNELRIDDVFRKIFNRNIIS